MVITAGMTTTAPPIASAAHSMAPMPSEMRMVSGPMSGASASVTTSAVPPISTARPEVSTARLEGDRLAGAVVRVDARRARCASAGRRAWRSSTPSASPAIDASVTAVASTSIALPSSAIAPKLMSVVTPPKAVEHERRDGRAEDDEQDEEEDRQREQLGPPSGVERLVLRREVDRRRAGDVWRHRPGDLVVDDPVDLLLDPVDHRLLGLGDRRDEHRVRRVRTQRRAGVADVPGRQDARVPAGGERLDERRPLLVELLPSALRASRARGRSGRSSTRPDARLVPSRCPGRRRSSGTARS